jgi:hypothetical protein
LTSGLAFHYKEAVAEPAAPVDAVDDAVDGEPAPAATGEESEKSWDSWDKVERMMDLPERSLDYIAKQAAKAKQPIRVRFTLSLLDPKSGQYKGWRGMNWKVLVKDVDEARELQELLELFFDTIDLGGITWTVELMAGGKRALVEAQKQAG